MNKTLYCVKLNQKDNKYLSVANTKNSPATMTQSIFDYAIFFDSTYEANQAIFAYMSNPNCKMASANKKFISIEPFDFEYDFKKYPVTNIFKLNNTDQLKDKQHDIFNLVYLQYGEFKRFVYICTQAYNSL